MKQTILAAAALMTLVNSLPAQAEDSELWLMKNPEEVARIQQEYFKTNAELAKEYKRITPLFLEDQHLLAKLPFFQNSPGRKDFAPFYNQLEQGEKLKLPPALAALDKEAVLAQASSLDLKGLDFGWLKQLSGYDHLDPTHLQANQAALKQNPLSPPLMLNVPFISTLTSWARLRLAQGLQNRDLPAALRETRQLAYLMQNSDTLIGSMVAVSMLRFENDALARWKTTVPGWQPMSDDTLKRAQRALAAAPGYFMLGRVPLEQFRQLRQDPQARVGICEALAEGSSSLLLTNLLPKPPQAEIDEIVAFARTQPCHFSQVNKIWDNPTAVSMAFLKHTIPARSFAILQSSPAKGETLYYAMQNLAIPNLLAGYKQP